MCCPGYVIVESLLVIIAVRKTKHSGSVVTALLPGDRISSTSTSVYYCIPWLLKMANMSLTSLLQGRVHIYILYIYIYIHIKIQLNECLITVTCVNKYSHKKKSCNLMNLEYYNIKIIYFISILFTNYGINWILYVILTMLNARSAFSMLSAGTSWKSRPKGGLAS